MSTFTSGKRATLGLPLANHDPMPYAVSFNGVESWRRTIHKPRFTNGFDEVVQDRHDPRPKFDVPDNPILADFRANHVRRQIGTPYLAKSWLRALEAGVDWDRESGRKGDPQQIIHARRVLSKLAALS